jgi:hypothetical protein
VNFSLLHSVRTGSGAHSTSCPVGTGAVSPGGSGRGVKLTTHLHLVPRSRTHDAVAPPSVRLHGVVLS